MLRTVLYSCLSITAVEQTRELKLDSSNIGKPKKAAERKKRGEIMKQSIHQFEYPPVPSSSSLPFL